MKTALITTTVNVPTVLELYRQHGPDVAFFVALDQKSADLKPWIEDLNNRGAGDSNTTIFTPAAQEKWKCSELIGWNCIQRRNIALLEAIKWGAEIIVSIDDDNILIDHDPVEVVPSYFKTFERELTRLQDGLKVSSPNGWFDVGQLLDPVAPHRGFPIQVDATKWRVEHSVDAKVGVAAGICLGDPDISAVTRIARAPVAHRVSELLNSGVVVDPNIKTVFNSQNTAFIRELAPAMFMMPGVGRYDDIYASLICQRIMRERGLHVHFGKPFCWQQRNPHNLIRDLRQEIDGMENVERFANWLDTTPIWTERTTVVDAVRQIYRQMRAKLPYGIPQESIDAALAFLEDLEGVM